MMRTEKMFSLLFPLSPSSLMHHQFIGIISAIAKGTRYVVKFQSRFMDMNATKSINWDEGGTSSEFWVRKSKIEGDDGDRENREKMNENNKKKKKFVEKRWENEKIN